MKLKVVKLQLLADAFSIGTCDYSDLRIMIIETIDQRRLKDRGIDPIAFMKERWVKIQY